MNRSSQPTRFGGSVRNTRKATRPETDRYSAAATPAHPNPSVTITSGRLVNRASLACHPARSHTERSQADARMPSVPVGTEHDNADQSAAFRASLNPASAPKTMARPDSGAARDTAAAFRTSWSASVTTIFQLKLRDASEIGLGRQAEADSRPLSPETRFSFDKISSVISSTLNSRASTTRSHHLEWWASILGERSCRRAGRDRRLPLSGAGSTCS